MSWLMRAWFITYGSTDKDNQWNSDFDYMTTLPGGSHLSFSDPHVKLADMNGDRMEDLVYVIDGYVSYFPSMGQGAFDDEVAMADPPSDLGYLADSLSMSDIWIINDLL